MKGYGYLKKIISIIMLVVLTVTVSIIPAFATETGVSSTMKYEAPEEFIVTIPLEFNVGEDLDIGIERDNFASPKLIDVTVEGLPEYGAVSLTNINNADYSITAFLYNNDGDTLNSTNNKVGTLDSKSNQYIRLSSSVDWYDPYSIIAGSYSAYIYFTLTCVDKP